MADEFECVGCLTKVWLKMRDTIFICYSRKDSSWREAFEKKLHIGVVQGKYALWSDQETIPSEFWDEKIESILSTSRAALVLVTRELMESDYILWKEFRRIFAINRVNGLGIYWVPIHKIP